MREPSWRLKEYEKCFTFPVSNSTKCLKVTKPHSEAWTTSAGQGIAGIRSEHKVRFQRKSRCFWRNTCTWLCVSRGSSEALELRKSCNSRNKVDIVSQKLRENDWEYRKARNTLHACCWSCPHDYSCSLQSAKGRGETRAAAGCQPLPLISLNIASGRQISLRCFAELVFQFRIPRYV